MKKLRWLAAIASVSVCMGLVLGAAESDDPCDHWRADLSSIAERLGLPSAAAVEYSTNQLLESIVARLPVWDSTGQVSLQAVTLSNEFKIRQPATLVFRTAAHATCTLDVSYCETGGFADLDEKPKTANGSGLVEWTWVIGTNNPTKAIAKVEVSVGEITLDGEFPFYITAGGAEEGS